jgi:diguanylate cyclase (GGDEF)-like protein/PAS domain S-box-containing protein
MDTKSSLVRRRTQTNDTAHRLNSIDGAMRGGDLRVSTCMVEDCAEDSPEAGLRTVLNGAAIGIALVDPQGRIVDANRALAEMLGYDSDEISHVSLLGPSRPDNPDAGLNLYQQLMSRGAERFEAETRCVRKDGQLIWCHVTAALSAGGEGVPPTVVATLEDTTERRWMAEALEEKERQLSTVIDQARDGIFIGTPRGLVIMYNRAMETISGYSMIEANEDGWFELAFPDPVDNAGVVGITARAVAGESGTTEVPISRKDGTTGWVAISVSPIAVGGQKFALGIVTDITKGKQQEERLVYLATHDALTGLPNRLTLEEGVGKELARARVRGARSVLLSADLDNFKLVNDTLGHSAGDQVLISLTQVVKCGLRSEDVLARLGGDELAILLIDTTPEGGFAVADRLRQAVDEHRFCVGNHSFHLGLSIGAAPISGQPDVGVVLSQADAAMYQAKARGRNRVVMCQADSVEILPSARSDGWAARLNGAMLEEGLVVCFQPLVTLSNGRVACFEARPYLRADGGELISPEAFTPDAERLGLMPHLSRWLIARVVEELESHHGLLITISLSPQSLASDELLSFIESSVRERTFDPASLGFEIAETSVSRALIIAERWMERLKSLGCYVVVDDFGSGFSSFGDLRNLPVDLLKIDGAIVRRLKSDPGERVVVQAIQSLASIMGMEVAAKSVDSEEVYQSLREIGVPYGLGDYLGGPRQQLPEGSG